MLGLSLAGPALAHRGLLTVVASGGAAVITSSAAVGQPGATQRFFRATADRAGTWALGTGGNVADFAIDATTGIYNIKASAAGDGSAQIVKTVPLVFTPADGSGVATQTVTVTLAPAAAPGQLSTSTTSTFAGAAGTRLDQLTGWATNDGQPFNSVVLDGNGGLTQGGSKNDAQVCVRQAPTRNNLALDFRVIKGDGLVGICAASDGNGNQVEVTLKAVGNVVVIPDGNAVWLTQGGTRYPQGVGDISAPFNAQGYVDFRISFSADGKIVTLGFPSSGKFWTDTHADLTLGKGYGFCFNQYVGFPISGDVRVTQVVATLQATQITAGAAPTASADNTATWPLAWNTALARPAGLQHSFDGGSTWLTGESQVADGGAISYVGSAPSAGLLTPAFRVLNDTVSTTKAPNATRFLYATHKFEVGYGVDYPNYYFNFCPLNDWGKVCTIQDGQVYVCKGGITTKAGQVDTVTTDVGVTLSSSHPTLSVDHTDPTTGIHTVRVLGDSDDRRSFGVTATNGITRFSVSRGGVTGKISPEWVAGMTGSGWRTLDVSGANFPHARPPLVTDTNYEPYKGMLPHQDIIDMHAACMAAIPGFYRLWLVLRVDIPDDEIAAMVAYARDNLPLNAEICFTYLNEDWNGGFAVGFHVQIFAMMAGYWGGATWNTPQPRKTMLGMAGGQDPFVGSNLGFYKTGDASNTDGPAAKAGDWVLYGLSGASPCIFEAKADLAAGTTIGDNANWLRRPEVYSTCNVEGFKAVRHNQIIEMFRTGFGEARFQKQVVPVLDGWAIRHDLDVYFKARFDFVPGYQAKIKGMGHGFYLSADPAWFTSTNPTAATLDAAVRADMLADKRPGLLQLVVKCVEMGVTPYLYEGGPFQFDGLSGAYLDAYNAYIRSSLIHDLFYDEAVWLKANVPGVLMFFLLYGPMPFCLKESLADNSPRFSGWTSGLAA